MEYYPFRFDVKRLRPLLQKQLYKDPNVVLRELAQNAHDAIMRRSRLDTSFKPERDGEIVFEVHEPSGTLSISDSGAGMSRDAILVDAEGRRRLIAKDSPLYKAVQAMRCLDKRT